MFWTALGFGVLVGGWIAPAMLGAMVLVLGVERGSLGWTKRLHPRAGVVWLAVLALPWLAAVAITYATGAAANAPSATLLQRLAVPFRQIAPPGTYSILAEPLIGPAMGFVLVATPWILANLRRPAIFFGLAWGLPVWLAAELVAVKLPYHVLPAIPTVAMVAAIAIDAGGARITGMATGALALIPATLRILLAIAAPVAFLIFYGRFPIAACLAFAVGAAAALVAWRWLRAGEAAAAAVASVAGAVAIHLGFFGWLLPQVDHLHVSDRVVALVAETTSCAGPTLVVSGYPEESIVFVAGPGTRMVEAAQAADLLDAPGCRAAAIDQSQLSSFRQRAADLGLTVVDQGVVSGLDIRKLRRVRMHVFTAVLSG